MKEVKHQTDAFMQHQESALSPCRPSDFQSLFKGSAV